MFSNPYPNSFPYCKTIVPYPYRVVVPYPYLILTRTTTLTSFPYP